MIEPEQTWRLDGACRDQDPELFFPFAANGPEDTAGERRAKAVCRDCPVRATCLRFALDTAQKYGVWGGASEYDRERMLRRPRRHEEVQG